MPGVRGTSPLSGMVFTAVFTEWCRSPGALKSRMWDSGWDHRPAGCEVGREALQDESALGQHRNETLDGVAIM